MNYKIYVPGFFDSHRAFPWDILGYGVPKYGTVHSYVCSILAPLGHRIERPLLAGRPSMSEIYRLSKVVKEIDTNDYDPPFVTADIYEYCNWLYEKEKKDRVEVAQEVLDCLRKFDHYKVWLHGRLDYLWRQGLINIPKEHLVMSDTNSSGSGSNNYGF